ncbi:MAG: NifU family protein [Candidatus Thalassarchaeaceae archaeon]|jgi:Fe-S cluster biogenesis protein NfuA|nr:NifU family protein [Candidatus Thalassarchaeaceae archaeon]MDP7042761.1 NifU family protein [Candidatus Thalassarchaeaceae archaeon]
MEEDDLAERYRAETSASIAHESDVRLTEVINLEEDEHFSALSLVDLVKEGEASDLVGALMVRLGEVRVALIEHGGTLLVDHVEVVTVEGVESVSLQLNLDGACIACGAAPGTLQGIQDDLLGDKEVSAVLFSASMLNAFDELTREFLQLHGNVTFI